MSTILSAAPFLIQSLSADISTDSCSTSIGTFSVAISKAIWFHSIQQEGVVHVLKCNSVLKCSGKVRVIPRGQGIECPYAVIVIKDLLQNLW